MTLVPGATLGPYTILAELGHGGKGVVYTAQDPRLDRQVAIKVLPPDLTRDETAKQRFEDFVQMPGVAHAPSSAPQRPGIRRAEGPTPMADAS